VRGTRIPVSVVLDNLAAGPLERRLWIVRNGELRIRE
jgi:hypothetical protein